MISLWSLREVSLGGEAGTRGVPGVHVEAAVVIGALNPRYRVPSRFRLELASDVAICSVLAIGARDLRVLPLAAGRDILVQPRELNIVVGIGVLIVVVVIVIIEHLVLALTLAVIAALFTSSAGRRRETVRGAILRDARRAGVFWLVRTMQVVAVREGVVRVRLPCAVVQPASLAGATVVRVFGVGLFGGGVFEIE